ncbi:hypothetical protein [Arthrobacter sp. CAN_A1]|uniref:hypothetical protein n=1 Tax=Arthrobacter sp. CAN_A1 TaxID=2787717 RepID=UPI0018C9FEDF
MSSSTIRPAAGWLLVVAAVLILGGVSLLFGVTPIVLQLPGPEAEASTAYSSDLVIALDGEFSFSDGLAIGGGVLLVGGLLVSATALGLRLGKESANDQ